MPLDYFNDDHYFACDVMTILPTMTNLKATDVYFGTDGSIKSGLSLYFKIYGFVLRLQEWNSRFNGDGIYLAYDIMYENSVVGFVNYYYNTKKQSFSYRQSVLCTFDLSSLANGAPITNNIMLNLEYSDIPIANPLSPEFEAGQLNKKTGELEKNVVIDRFTLSDRLYRGGEGLIVDSPRFSRAFITTREVYKNGSYVTYAFVQPDGSVEHERTPWENLGQDMVSIMQKYSDGDDYLIDTEEERAGADVNLIFDFLPLMYGQGSSIVEHNKEAKFVSNGYRSYDEYVLDSFNSSLREEFENRFSQENVQNCYPRPVIFKYGSEHASGASSAKNVSQNSGERFLDAVGSSTFQENSIKRDYQEDRYEKSGFKTFYGEFDKKDESDNLEKFLIRKHLEACGISPNESNYIEKFMEEYLRWEGTNRSTTINPIKADAFK